MVFGACEQKHIETMDDRYIHTLQVSQWFNLWHSYQPIFQLATKIDFQYIALFFAARIMIRFSQIHYKMDYSDICINHDGMNRRLWSIFYITHIMQWIKKATKQYHRLLMNHELSAFFRMFPLLGRDLSPTHPASPSKMHSWRWFKFVSHPGIRTKTACCHTFWDIS